jgi:soluble lytic murein transglycosylase-like protein
MATIKSARVPADAVQVTRTSTARTPTARRATRPAWIACAAVLLLFHPASAEAADDSAAQTRARAAAEAAARQVAAVTAELTVAERAYAAAAAVVGVSVTDSVLATTSSDDAARAALIAQDRTAASARALYQGGGQYGLIGSLLQSGDMSDLTVRMIGVRQVLSATDADAASARSTARVAESTARRLADGAQAAVVTADQVARRAARIEQLLAQAQARLDALSARAKQLSEAAAAQRALDQASAAAAASQATAAQGVRAQMPPSAYFALYRSAAATCPGMQWSLLAAVGQVESGHGRNVGPSSAGAVGPMQFMPATFAAYAVDGDRDGKRDAFNPADAIYTAARYLCQAGGGGSPSGVRAALFTYNHAQWYVDLVLGVQRKINATPGL